jgi:hypothetical protein
MLQVTLIRVGYDHSSAADFHAVVVQLRTQIAEVGQRSISSTCQPITSSIRAIRRMSFVLTLLIYENFLRTVKDGPVFEWGHFVSSYFWVIGDELRRLLSVVASF